MRLLVIDTSGPVCGVAVLDDDRVLCEYTVQNRNTHSANLMPMTEAVLASAGLSAGDLDAIAAVIVGGTAMSGGRGSLIGAFLGMLITGVMNNILNSVGVPTFLTEAVKGLIIIFAVLLQKKDN